MISLVIPYYNEFDCIRELLHRVRQVFVTLPEEACEIIIIDNGSTSYQSEALQVFTEDWPEVRIVRLSRNFGYQGALWAGLDSAKGEAVIFMDGDGEDPPEVIPRFVEQWKEGYQVAYGVRLSRRNSAFSRFCYWAFYRLLARFSALPIPLDAGEFSLVAGPALSALRRFQDRTRMMRILRAWVGYRQVAVPYHRESRIAGQSKFSFFKAVTFAWDGFTASTDLPVRLSIYCSIGCLLFGITGSIYYLFWYFFAKVKIPGFATLNITVLVLFSVLFGCFSILARYIITLLDETRKRPPYLIDKEILPHSKSER